MSNPYSLPVRLRLRLSRWLDPDPDAGEAWCIQCSLNNRRTKILPADGMKAHAQEHRDAEGSSRSLTIRAAWPLDSQDNPA